MIQYENNASSTLASGIGTGDTSITVKSGEGDRFPAVSSPDYFMLTLVDVSGNREIVKCTARTLSSDTMTIVRQQEGTGPQSFSTDDIVSLRVTAGTLEGMRDGDGTIIDGDVIDIDWDPTYYTPDTTPSEASDVDDLTAHLYGIDQELNTIDGKADTHVTRHEQTGADEMDGDKLDIDWDPTYFTPDTPAEGNDVNSLSSHLKGIDDKFGETRLLVDTTGRSASNTTSETTFSTFTIPANSLGPNGIANAKTHFTIQQGTGSPYVLTVKFKLGGTQYINRSLTMEATAGNTEVAAIFEYMVGNLNSTSSQIIGFKLMIDDTSIHEWAIKNNFSANDGITVSEDTTSSKVVEITFTMSTAAITYNWTVHYDSMTIQYAA